MKFIKKCKGYSIIPEENLDEDSSIPGDGMP